MINYKCQFQKKQVFLPICLVKLLKSDLGHTHNMRQGMFDILFKSIPYFDTLSKCDMLVTNFLVSQKAKQVPKSRNKFFVK